MHQIPEKWHAAAMAFSLDLAKDNEILPKKVLSLFDKHFGFRRSIFRSFRKRIETHAPAGRPQSSELEHGLENNGRLRYYV